MLHSFSPAHADTQTPRHSNTHTVHTHAPHLQTSAVAAQVNTPLREAARHCWRNRHFRCYVFADLAFFYTSAMIQTALPFYLTV